MKLGNSEVEVNENFRLYLLTALPNPSFLPSVCNRVNVVNFTITFDCLVKQLLSSTVQHVQPELERNLIQLLGQVDKDKITLQTLEDKALFMLEHREGHLLDDQILVETLHRTKVMSEEIQARLEKAGRDESKIQQVRDVRREDCIAAWSSCRGL